MRTRRPKAEGGSESQAAKLSAGEKALRLLAHRDHFRAELERKLERLEYPAEEIVSALDRLREQGYLDEERAASNFVASRRRRGPEGSRRLRSELTRRGAAPEAIDRALGAGESEEKRAAAVVNEKADARRAAEAWLARHALDSDRARAALARHLHRKGFGAGTIWAVLDEVGGSGSDSEPSD